MTDRPYRGVDPLLGTPLPTHAYTPKPELQKRLDEPHQSRVTPQGTFRQGQHGLEFVPKGVIGLQQIAEPAPAFVPGAMVRITGCIDALWTQDPWPMTLELAAGVAGLIGRVDQPSEDGSGLYVEVNGHRLLLLPCNVCSLSQAELKDAVQPAEGDDEPVVDFKHMPAQAELGALSLNEAQALFYKELLLSHEETAQVLHRYTCDLKPCDWVEIIDGPLAGHQGSVRYTRHGAPVIDVVHGGTVEMPRVNVRLMTRFQG